MKVHKFYNWIFIPNSFIVKKSENFYEVQLLDKNMLNNIDLAKVLKIKNYLSLSPTFI